MYALYYNAYTTQSDGLSDVGPPWFCHYGIIIMQAEIVYMFRNQTIQYYMLWLQLATVKATNRKLKESIHTHKSYNSNRSVMRKPVLQHYNTGNRSVMRKPVLQHHNTGNRSVMRKPVLQHYNTGNRSVMRKPVLQHHNTGNRSVMRKPVLQESTSQY